MARQSRQSKTYDPPDSPTSVGWTEARTVRLATVEQPLVLESGASLGPVDVEYEMYGELNAARDNAILIAHALSGDAHAAGWDARADATGRTWRKRKPGWWDTVVGPGKPVDTSRYCVICANVLGSCCGTTGPGSPDPETGRPYGLSFPMVTVRDWVRLQASLLDFLGIERLHAVLGGSLGGQQALEWALAFPERVRKAIILAASHRLSAQGLGFNAVGRHAVMHDPDFLGGDYYHSRPPRDGLAAARMLAHITYLSGKGMETKFGRRLRKEADRGGGFEIEFEVESYLDYQGRAFVERFDANSYLYITRAMDYYDAADAWGKGDLTRAAARIRSRVLVVSFSSDWLYTPDECRELALALTNNRIPVTYVNVHSDYGHDAFLVETETVGRLLCGFLGNPGESSVVCRCAESGGCGPRREAEREPIATPGPGRGYDALYGDEPDADADRLFGGDTAPAPPGQADWHQWEDPIIEELVPAGATVLDLGCGDGTLLARLMSRKGVCGQGVDLNQESVIRCVSRGVPVFHGDLDLGLAGFPDGSFDVVILEETLQTLRHPMAVLAEMLRVGRCGIVTFPNFAHEHVRRAFALKGRMPVTGSLPHQWYDTPNIHLFSIRDFLDWTVKARVEVLDARVLAGGTVRALEDGDNLAGEEALFVVRRKPSA